MQIIHLSSKVPPILLLIQAVTLVAAADNNEGSPPSCDQICDYFDADGDAYCGGRNLSEVPSVCSGSVLLDMSGNAVHNLRQGEFQDFTNLMFLDLSANSLENLPPRVFSGATQLQDIYMINNHLTYVGHDAFADTGNIRSIYLSRNDIHALPPSVFRGLSSLNVLYLSRNQLSYVNRHMFIHNNNLTHLSLAHNQLEVLLSETFKHLSKLEFLDVSYNQLHNLRIHTFVSLLNLRLFKAANNSLGSDFLDIDLLESSPKLEILELGGNEIEYIPSNLEESHLAKLRLTGNPLVCDCFLQPLQNAYNALQEEERWVDQVTCSNGELLITTSLECPTSASMDKVMSTHPRYHEVDENPDNDINTATREVHNSFVVPFIITGTVFAVCFAICAYVTIKWIKSCKSSVTYAKVPNAVNCKSSVTYAEVPNAVNECNIPPKFSSTEIMSQNTNPLKGMHMGPFLGSDL